MDAFRPNIPIILGLRNSGMRDRHWSDLSSEIGFVLRPDETFTLTNVLELDLHLHLDAIRKVGERAAKEFHIEQQLDKMSTEWNDVMLDIEPYRSVSLLRVSACLSSCVSVCPSVISFSDSFSWCFACACW